MNKAIVSSLLLAATALPTSTWAQTASVTTSTNGRTTDGAGVKSGSKAQDKIVCEDQEEIGTRLGGQRVCKRASEWAAERHSMRSDIERDQATVRVVQHDR